MTLSGLMAAVVVVFLAVGLFAPPARSWWAAMGKCPGCGDPKDRHRASGCLEFGCDCGLPYGERGEWPGLVT